MTTFFTLPNSFCTPKFWCMSWYIWSLLSVPFRLWSSALSAHSASSSLEESRVENGEEERQSEHKMCT